MAHNLISAEGMLELQSIIDECRQAEEKERKDFEKAITQKYIRHMQKLQAKHQSIITQSRRRNAQKDREIADLKLKLAVRDNELITKKEPVAPPPTVFECTKCKVKLEGVRKYREHVKECMEPYKCPTCKKNYADIQSLKIHLKTHSK